MPATDINNIIYNPQSDSQGYSPPSPVSTNPFRRSPSVSPSLSATPSLTSRPPLQVPDEDPFSLSAVAAALDPAPVPTLPSHISMTSQQLQEQQQYEEVSASSLVPPDLPPPPAYTQTATVLDDRASGFSGAATSDATSVATLSPAPSVNTSAPATAVPIGSVPATTTTTTTGASQSRTSLSREPEPVNQYVLKPVDWIDPATGIEKRIKIITQNGKISQDCRHNLSIGTVRAFALYRN